MCGLSAVVQFHSGMPSTGEDLVAARILSNHKQVQASSTCKAAQDADMYMHINKENTSVLTAVGYGSQAELRALEDDQTRPELLLELIQLLSHIRVGSFVDALRQHQRSTDVTNFRRTCLHIILITIASLEKKCSTIAEKKNIFKFKSEPFLQEKI